MSVCVCVPGIYCNGAQRGEKKKRTKGERKLKMILVKHTYRVLFFGVQGTHKQLWGEESKKKKKGQGWNARSAVDAARGGRSYVKGALV